MKHISLVVVALLVVLACAGPGERQASEQARPEVRYYVIADT